MKIDRPALKGRAKALVTGSKPSPIWVGLVYLLLAIVVSWLSARIMGISLTTQELANYSNAVLNGDYDYIYQLLAPRMPGPAAYAIDLALQLVLAVVSAGFVLFLMNTVRRTGACFGNLLDGFGMFEGPQGRAFRHGPELFGLGHSGVHPGFRLCRTGMDHALYQHELCSVL